jgi:hypothetical protein
MDNEELCYKLSKLNGRMGTTITSDFDAILQQIEEVEDMAPEDEELRSLVAAARENVHTWQRITAQFDEAKRLSLPEDTKINVSDALQFGSYSRWLAALDAYKQKHCYLDELSFEALSEVDDPK